jgi:hypothetical protein
LFARQLHCRGDILQLGTAFIMSACAGPGTPEVEAENGMAPVDQPICHGNHQRSVHRPSLQWVGVAEDGEVVGVPWGINTSLERFTI